MVDTTILEHLVNIEFLIASFATSLFMVASLATGLRWWTRIVMALNMLLWAYNSIDIKYPWIIEAYLEILLTDSPKRLSEFY